MWGDRRAIPAASAQYPLAVSTSPARPPASHPGTGLPSVFRGAAYPLRGPAFLARTPSIWRTALVPVLVHMLILGVLGFGALFLVDDVAAWLRPAWIEAPRDALVWWKAWAAWLLWGALGVGAFLATEAVALMGSLILVVVLAGTFQERLSEAAECAATGRPPPAEAITARSLAVDITRGLGSALMLLAFSVGWVPLFLLSLLPGVGPFFSMVAAAWSAHVCALTFFDPVLERRKLNAFMKLRWCRTVFGPWMGFGAAVFGLMLIPVLNLLITPALVVGSTLLWIDLGGDASLLEHPKNSPWHPDYGR